jgi:hypothetical protein
MHQIDIATLTFTYQDAGLYGEAPYCVGGALSHYNDAQRGCTPIFFPTSEYLTGTMLRLNPALKPDRARRYAQAIIMHNDAGRTSEAWHIAGMALALGYADALVTYTA